MDTFAKILELKPKRKIKQILGEDFFINETDPYNRIRLDIGSCYEFYYALGAFYQPKSILDIGTEKGWPIISMAIACNPETVDCIPVNTNYVEISNYIQKVMEKGFATKTKFNILNVDQGKVNSLVDFVHIDKNYNDPNVFVQEFQFAVQLRPKIIAIDNYLCNHVVKSISDRFFADNKKFINERFVMFNGGHLDDPKGLLILDMKEYLMRQ